VHGGIPCCSAWRIVTCCQAWPLQKIGLFWRKRLPAEDSALLSDTSGVRWCGFSIFGTSLQHSVFILFVISSDETVANINYCRRVRQ
jgi:hypothetical protein